MAKPYILQTVDDVKEFSKDVKNQVESHKADYATFAGNFDFPLATVIGTQIQISEQDQTRVYRFQITDNIDGGAITISLDNGETDLPLLDIEGEPVTELSKGFVEVVADATFFTLRSRGGKALNIDKNAFAFYGEGASLPSDGITSLASGDDYLYFSVDSDNQRLRRVNKETLSSVSRGEIFETPPRKILFYQGYVYAVFGNKIVKMEGESLDIVAENPDLPGTSYDMVLLSGYLYVLNSVSAFLGSGVVVRKLSVSNLEILATSSTLPNSSSRPRMAFEDGYIYSFASSSSVLKINAIDLSLVSESSTLGTTINAGVVVGGHIYVGVGSSLTKISTSNMEIIDTLSFGVVLSLVSDGTYIYGGRSTFRDGIRQINPTTFAITIEKSHPNLGQNENTTHIVFDGKYIYSASRIIRKYLAIGGN